jgi:hypothetical protein
MKKILFISRKAERCGVADYGRRVNAALQKSSLFETHWAEVETEADYINWYNKVMPDLVLYNYYPVILPFVTDTFLAPIRNVPHVTVYHEVGLYFHPDAIIDIDSTREDIPEQNYFTSPRPLFENMDLKDFPPNEVPTIGSFGFGFPDKNFPKIAELVCSQFDRAKIRLNTPFATFGDSDGNTARGEVEKMRRIIADSGKDVELEVTHDFLEHTDLLNFLKQNDINIFLYDPHNTRSLSGSIDYALSVRKPIGISRSWMFRHINWVTPSIFVDERPLKDIIADGIEPLKPIYEKHSNKALLEKYEYALTTILNKK